jgi:hypothetical protein
MAEGMPLPPYKRLLTERPADAEEFRGILAAVLLWFPAAPVLADLGEPGTAAGGTAGMGELDALIHGPLLRAGQVVG